MRTIVRVGAFVLGILVALSPVTRAAEDPIPRLFQGMWAAGTCAKPKFFLHIEGSGIQTFKADKRTPVGNWDIRATEKRESTLIIEAPETNSHEKFRFELFPLEVNRLRIKISSGGKAETNDFEACSTGTT